MGLFIHVPPPLSKPACTTARKEMHHWDTVSDKTPKVPAGSCASLIQRYLLSYCESILFSSRRLQFVTPALVILQLTSSSHLILSLCHTLQHLSPSPSSPLYSTSFSNSGFSSGQSRRGCSSQASNRYVVPGNL